MNLSLFQDAITVFLGIVVEAIPFVLLGVLASALIHVYVPSETILRFIPRSRFWSIVVGPFLGLIFPVCECGNIPLARRMIQKGVPHATVTSFLFAAPVFNPIVILATYAAFRSQPNIVFLRVGLSLLTAFLVSLIVSFAPRNQVIHPRLSESHHPVECDCGEKHFLSTLINEFIEMMSLLIFGAMVASLSQAIIPREILLKLGAGPVTSVLAMMALAATISICSNVDAFFILSYANTFSPGSILAFLVFGPMIDIKSIVMLRKIFTTKAVVYLSLLIAQIVFLIFVFYNLNIS